jgi:DNA-binding response OmpR family regulator
MEPQRTDEQLAQILAVEEHAAVVQPAEYVLEDDVCTIGRARTCEIVVSQSVVSRLHASIARNGPHYVLHDAGSANGTFVNEHKIFDPYLLKHKDQIGLGSPKPILRFFDPDATAMTPEGLRYDDRARIFILNRTPLDLTPAQSRLLFHLYQYGDEVCTRESCAQAIWGRNYEPGLDADALEQAVSKLRKRLREAHSAGELIETRPGVGYVLRLRSP